MTGVVVVRECRGSLGTLFILVSTWYLQQGSNCQDMVYTPAHIKLRNPIGSDISTWSGHIPATTRQLTPDNTAVLWRQFPHMIHLAASSPSFEGSTTIVFTPISKARSSSTSNSSCDDSCSYISRITVQSRIPLCSLLLLVGLKIYEHENQLHLKIKLNKGPNGNKIVHGFTVPYARWTNRITLFNIFITKTLSMEFLC